MTKRWLATEIEMAVAEMFGYRQTLIVPNVSWGLGLRYEADMVILRPSGWAIEVEIKVTSADIKADLKKRQCHNSNLFRRLYFAVPAELIKSFVMIPERAGIIIVEHKTIRNVNVAEIIRPAKINKDAIKMNADERRKIAELGCMRIWSLKKHLFKRETQ